MLQVQIYSFNTTAIPEQFMKIAPLVQSVSYSKDHYSPHMFINGSLMSDHYLDHKFEKCSSCCVQKGAVLTTTDVSKYSFIITKAVPYKNINLKYPHVTVVCHGLFRKSHIVLM